MKVGIKVTIRAVALYITNHYIPLPAKGRLRRSLLSHAPFAIGARHMQHAPFQRVLRRAKFVQGR